MEQKFLLDWLSWQLWFTLMEKLFAGVIKALQLFSLFYAPSEDFPQFPSVEGSVSFCSSISLTATTSMASPSVLEVWEWASLLTSPCSVL